MLIARQYRILHAHRAKVGEIGRNMNVVSQWPPAAHRLRCAISKRAAGRGPDPADFHYIKDRPMSTRSCSPRREDYIAA